MGAGRVASPESLSLSSETPWQCQPPLHRLPHPPRSGAGGRRAATSSSLPSSSLPLKHTCQFVTVCAAFRNERLCLGGWAARSNPSGDRAQRVVTFSQSRSEGCLSSFCCLLRKYHLKIPAVFMAHICKIVKIANCLLSRSKLYVEFWQIKLSSPRNAVFY